MSIETARIEWRRSPSSSKNACNVSGIATRRAPHDRAGGVVDDRGEVALAAARRSRRRRSRPARSGACRRDDRSRRARRSGRRCVPADAQQATDRSLGHLLGQPRDRVFEVAGVMGAGPGPGTGSARTTRQSGHLSSRTSHSMMQRVEPRSRWRQRLTRRSWISRRWPVCPHRAQDTTPAPQPGGHDHPLDGEADVDDRRAGKPEQPLECGRGAHVASCVSRLPSTASSLPGRTAARRHNPRNIHGSR